MAKHIFSYDYFSPEKDEGNLSLNTRESRIKEAIKLLSTPDDYIELYDESKKCYNEEELRAAIDEHDK